MKGSLFAIFLLLTATPLVADTSCGFNKQIRVLALNMYHEARGEPIDGRQMVGEVTLNRVDSDNYPDTICEVVYQRKQFSWTHTKKDHYPHEREVWLETRELAKDLILGRADYFDNGATHFINVKLVHRVPSWAKKFDTVGKIGNHVFYQEPI